MTEQHKNCIILEVQLHIRDTLEAYFYVWLCKDLGNSYLTPVVGVMPYCVYNSQAAHPGVLSYDGLLT